MIERIGHEQIPRTSHHDSKGVAQASIEGRTFVASIVCHTNTGDARNTTGSPIPSPYQMIVRIGEEEIPFFVQRNSRWP
jgi:hypothetical protein